MSPRAQATVDMVNGQLVFRALRPLKTPNAWQGRHWRYKHRETLAWQRILVGAAILQERARALWADLVKDDLEWRVSRERRRVTVTRLVPSVQHLIRDEDNLRFCVKPLNDALRRMGLIGDDSVTWLEQPMPEQRLSPDGHHWTVVEIGPVEDDL